jgi:hypothetical protein
VLCVLALEPVDHLRIINEHEILWVVAAAGAWADIWDGVTAWAARLINSLKPGARPRGGGSGDCVRALVVQAERVRCWVRYRVMQQKDTPGRQNCVQCSLPSRTHTVH